MKTSSHRVLGQFLAEQYLQSVSPAERSAFIFGCVEPDQNWSSFLRGSMRGKVLRGHNFENMRPYLGHLSDTLEAAPSSNIRYYYRLGNLTHYVADAFTWPHNKTFTGTMRDHVQYEFRLDTLVLERIFTAEDLPIGFVHQTLYDWLLDLHREYLSAPAGPETDLRYIFNSVKTTVLWLREAEAFGTAPVASGGIL